MHSCYTQQHELAGAVYVGGLGGAGKPVRGVAEVPLANLRAMRSQYMVSQATSDLYPGLLAMRPVD